MFEMVGSELWQVRLRVWVALLTRRVMTGEHVGQAVPGGVAGCLSLSLAGVAGRLALFQSIGWVPGDNLAYVLMSWYLDSPEFRYSRWWDPNSWRIRLRGSLGFGIWNTEGFAFF